MDALYVLLQLSDSEIFYIPQCLPVQMSAPIPVKMVDPVQLLTLVIVFQDGLECSVKQLLATWLPLNT